MRGEAFPRRSKVSFSVEGTPKTAGSKTIGRRKDGGIFIRSWSAGAVGKWMDACKVAAYAEIADAPPFAKDVPLELDLVFYLERPKTVRRLLPTVKPDLTKLSRAVEDALTGVVWKDDSQVVTATHRKLYAAGSWTGVRVEVRSIDTEVEA